MVVESQWWVEIRYLSSPLIVLAVQIITYITVISQSTLGVLASTRLVNLILIDNARKSLHIYECILNQYCAVSSY